MKRNARRKSGKINWEPKIGDLLFKPHAISDAVLGITGKFIHQYFGPRRYYNLQRIKPVNLMANREAYLAKDL
jgi:hypothetical protein